MEDRKQFTFYESIYKSLKRIKKKQDRADAYDAICAYALYQEEPDLNTLSDAAAIAFELLRPVLDSARKKAVNGKQGGSKPKAKGKQDGSKPKAKGKQDGSKPKAKGKQDGREKENEEEREIEIEGESDNKARTPDDDLLFNAFWNAYPDCAKQRREEALEAWKRLDVSAEKADQIMAHLSAWKESRRWTDDNGAFIPGAEKFLNPARGYLTYSPPPAKQAASVWGSGELGEAELESIRRTLREEVPDEQGD